MVGESSRYFYTRATRWRGPVQFHRYWEPLMAEYVEPTMLSSVLYVVYVRRGTQLAGTVITNPERRRAKSELGFTTSRDRTRELGPS